jgi:hypothetical protein
MYFRWSSTEKWYADNTEKKAEICYLFAGKLLQPWGDC